jgi:DNA gyrase/topoisomerase IV subunit B
MACPGQNPDPDERAAEAIRALTGLDHIRQRPQMPIGSTDARGRSSCGAGLPVCH